MLDNLKMRFFLNLNIKGTHYKRAIGFTIRLDEKFKDEILIVPGPDGFFVSDLFGNGHIRMAVQYYFEKQFGDKKPIFEEVWEELAYRPNVIKVKNRNYRRYSR